MRRIFVLEEQKAMPTEPAMTEMQSDGFCATWFCLTVSAEKP